MRGAAELALPHRRRRKPFEQPGLDQERLDELMQQALQAPNEPGLESNTDQDDEAPQSDANSTEPQVFVAAAAGNAPRILVDTHSQYAVVGKRNAAMAALRGQVIQVVPDQNPSSLAISATLRSAALRDANFKVTKHDLHQQIRSGKSANLILFVVDASGSMAAQRRMETVKGAVLTLLTDAY